MISISLCGSSEPRVPHTFWLSCAFLLFYSQGNVPAPFAVRMLCLIEIDHALSAAGNLRSDSIPNIFDFFKKRVGSLTQSLATAQQAAPFARDVPVVELTWPLNQVHVSDAKQRRRLEIASSFCVSLDDACRPANQV